MTLNKGGLLAVHEKEDDGKEEELVGLGEPKKP